MYVNTKAKCGLSRNVAKIALPLCQPKLAASATSLGQKYPHYSGQTPTAATKVVSDDPYVWFKYLIKVTAGRLVGS